MEFTCEICGKLFKLKSSLKRHLKKVHKEEQDYRNYYICMEESCSHKFRRNSDFVEHLQTNHTFIIEREEKEFSSLQDFLSWKQQIEVDERCNYVVACGTKTLTSGNNVTYYKCNRSGFFKSKAEKEHRMLKSQGTCKINRSCTSQITVNRRPDSTISLFRIKTHYGHTTDLQHLRLPKTDRENIAAKLISGVSQTRIIDSYRTKIGSELKRADLVTNRDLFNIKRDYKINIQQGMKHRDDAMSIEMWVEECKNGVNNPVLFYKRQGDAHVQFAQNDFCLIFMNQYQKTMLTSFGKNIIAIDSTHGLNNYDFELTTVMVIDDYGEGFPVCCMFSNRKDTFINHIFFEKIRDAVGIIKAKTFMSDVTEVYFNAWLSVMGNVEHKLYCSWHIDRAWQKNLPKIPNNEKRKTVYKTLKTLQQNMDSVEHFQQNLNTFIEKLQEDVDTHNFSKYFISTYAHNFQQWAYCYRKGCGINTNMVLESMHKTVKYFYLNGKIVKRLDKGLHAVLNYIRDKMVDRIIKATKGKQTSSLKDIIQRHRVSITCNFSVKEVEDGKKWEINSDDFQYVVKKINSTKCCQLFCQYCNICVHSYTCSCPDFNIKVTICKHIHYIANNFEKNDDSMTAAKIEPYSDKCDDIARCLGILNKSNNCKDQIGGKILSKLALVTNKVYDINLETVDENILSQMLFQIQNLESLLNISLSSPSKTTTFKNISSVSSNKKIERQLTFHSTKKKKKKITHTKPNAAEKKSINSFLSGNDTFISYSPVTDHNYCKE